MKTKRYMIAGFGVFLVLTAVMAQYAVEWATIDGGGGAAAGGVYAVSGTVGQPDAGDAMAGGGYSVVGGFWAVYAVQSDGAPFLSIALSGPAEVTVSWEPDDPGWVLQQTLDLEHGVWIIAPSVSTNPAVIPVTQPTTFYRLNR